MVVFRLFSFRAVIKNKRNKKEQLPAEELVTSGMKDLIYLVTGEAFLRGVGYTSSQAFKLLKDNPVNMQFFKEYGLRGPSFEPAKLTVAAEYQLSLTPKFDTIKNVGAVDSQLVASSVPQPPRPYAPDRTLPVKDGVGIPDPEAQGYAHTQLGTQRSKGGKDYSYVKARESNEYGIAVRDIEFTNHRRQDHADPHQHRWLPNETGGTLKRGDAEPLSHSFVKEQTNIIKEQPKPSK